MSMDNVKATEDSIVESLIDVNRVTKVLKGGRKFSFSACVIAGDKSGRVGYGHGKANEVTDARAKASQGAKKALVRVPLLEGRTIHHDVMGRSGAGKVLLRKAKPGTGVIAGGPLRAIFECLGVQDIVAKSLGSSNSYAMVAATFDALSNLSSPKMIAERRNKKVGDIFTTPKD